MLAWRAHSSCGTNSSTSVPGAFGGLSRRTFWHWGVSGEDVASFGLGALRSPGLYTQLSQALSSAPWGSGLRPAWPFPGCLAHGPVSHLPPYRQDTPSLSTVHIGAPPFVPGPEGRRELEGLESDPRNFRSHDPSPQPPYMLPNWVERWERALLSRAATEP